MRLIQTLDGLEPAARGAAVAIGNFDGVHPGHQAVIAHAMQQAKQRGIPSGVVTFEPHPRRFLRPDTPAFSLTQLSDKAELMGALGIDYLYALDFNAAMAARTADGFVTDILVHGLGVAHVTVGHDFHFGRDRAGNPDLLASVGAMHGFTVACIEPVSGDNGLYSSTSIRTHLMEGRPAEAARLLGRYWSITGIVTQGDQRGRTIDFPTANIALGDYMEPALGVYAVRVKRADGQALIGVANLGRRPTFDGMGVRLEVHIFDFSGDLYGETLAVSLVDFIRPEQKFDGLAALKAQIAQDAAKARAILVSLK